MLYYDRIEVSEGIDVNKSYCKMQIWLKKVED